VRLDAQQHRALLSSPAGWIACGFGSGLSPWAPGTAGSLAALVPWLALRELAWPVCLSVVVLAFVVGVWASTVVVAKLQVDDPGFIVWDEFVGQWISLFPLLWLSRDLRWMVAAFAMFRLFDVWKPWPISWADRHVKGGLGVMLDDVIAGIFAAIGVVLLRLCVV
jgi:phosphatidylglycerophosphatase A